VHEQNKKENILLLVESVTYFKLVVIKYCVFELCGVYKNCKDKDGVMNHFTS